MLVVIRSDVRFVLVVALVALLAEVACGGASVGGMRAGEVEGGGTNRRSSLRLRARFPSVWGGLALVLAGGRASRSAAGVEAAADLGRRVGERAL